jgi:hypothetical protein
MASLRKKYADHVEVGAPRQDEPPVSVPPTGAAKLPDEPAADVKPPPEEMPEPKESPADAAAKHAMRERLREMETAETLSRQAQQPPQYAAEPQQQPQQPQQPAVPAHVERWLAAHPQYLDPNDHVAQAEIHLATVKCMRDGKMWDDADFLPTIERHLGLRQQLQPQSNGNRMQQPAPAPRPAPARQYSAPVSAPPTREAPSMTTGRMPSAPARLTAEQKELCRSLGLSETQYAEELRKMEAMKRDGQII